MKIIRLLIFLLVITGFATAIAQPMRLSPSARISLITCGPWQGELYSAFGHSAYRVLDPVANIDWVFNYGTFDFNQPNFYLNFARGRNMYMLAVQDYPPFRNYYQEHNRYIHEQVLNLDIHQSQLLFNYLWNNAQPENRTYRYDYFYDNCSTRPRDVLKAVFGNDIHFDFGWVKESPSIRDLTDQYLIQQPWGDLGIDICLGLPMDKAATAEEHLFLPDYLEKAFDHATISFQGKQQPLVLEKASVFEPHPETFPLNWTHPWVIFGVLAGWLIYASYRNFRNKDTSRAIDNTLLIVTGSLGLLLTLLWLATDHAAAARNLNLLWAMPLNLVALFLSGKIKALYFRCLSVLTGLLVITWPILPQELNIYLLPIVFGLLARYVLNGWFSDRPAVSPTPA